MSDCNFLININFWKGRIKEKPQHLATEKERWLEDFVAASDAISKLQSLISREQRDALCASSFAQLCDPPEVRASVQALAPC